MKNLHLVNFFSKFGPDSILKQKKIIVNVMILISPHPTGHGLQISELKRKLEFCKSYMDEFDNLCKLKTVTITIFR